MHTHVRPIVVFLLYKIGEDLKWLSLSLSLSLFILFLRFPFPPLFRWEQDAETSGLYSGVVLQMLNRHTSLRLRRGDFFAPTLSAPSLHLTWPWNVYEIQPAEDLLHKVACLVSVSRFEYPVHICCSCPSGHEMKFGLHISVKLIESCLQTACSSSILW
jgi:hypothetical protein